MKAGDHISKPDQGPKDRYESFFKALSLTATICLIVMAISYIVYLIVV